jgi:hypothetical protein
VIRVKQLSIAFQNMKAAAQTKHPTMKHVYLEHLCIDEGLLEYGSQLHRQTLKRSTAAVLANVKAPKTALNTLAKQLEEYLSFQN